MKALSLFSGGLDSCLAASITARYSDAPHARTKVEYFRLPQKEKRYIEVVPVKDEKLETLRIGDK